MSKDDSDDTTTSTQTRWAYTNDIAAFALIVSVVVALGAVAYGIATGQIPADAIPTSMIGWAYIVAVLLAATWLFGNDALDALSKLRGGG